LNEVIALLIAWHVQRGISTIPKSITPARLRENLAAAEVELTKTELGSSASTSTVA
jgi:diketogulonate reductase-like aldo/keto reductase